MHADPRLYPLTAAPTLALTLALLAEGTHLPIAGGTELMVAFNAGRLAPRPLVSLAHLRELRFIDVAPQLITLGGGTTFTDLRRHPAIAAELPLLAQAASWTGSIANQNRATLAGNLCNASPAADSPPALLLYDPMLLLISAAGSRTVPLAEFFLGYRKTALRPDELLYAVQVPRAFTEYRGYLRKVGTRNAQAISKVALGALILERDDHVQDIRLAAASLLPVPARLRRTEQALRGQQLTEATMLAASEALSSEVAPIDDIRSTRAYRTAVARNLLREALLPGTEHPTIR